MKNKKSCRTPKSVSKWKIMRIFRKTGWMLCLVFIMLCSCSSSKHPYKKRYKMAPCDCPKFNYVPKNENIFV